QKEIASAMLGKTNEQSQVIIIGCGGGASPTLLPAIAKTFGVTARGYKKAIGSCNNFKDSMRWRQITKRGFFKYPFEPGKAPAKGCEAGKFSQNLAALIPDADAAPPKPSTSPHP